MYCGGVEARMSALGAVLSVSPTVSSPAMPGSYLNVREGYIAHHVGMVIYHSDRRDALVVHEMQCLR